MASMSDYAGENVFKSRAYARAAEIIHHLDREITDIIRSGGSPKDVPGIGDGISELVRELVSTGGSKAYRELAAKVPRDFFEMLKISGIGVKKLKALCESLNINLLDELFDCAKNGRVETVKGFSKKSEQLVIAEIERIKAVGRSKLYFVADETCAELEALIQKIPGVKNSVRCGELARRLPVVSSVSILVNIADASEAERAADGIINSTRSEAVRRLSSGGTVYLSADSALTDIPLHFYITSLSDENFNRLAVFLSFKADFLNEAVLSRVDGSKAVLPPVTAEDLGGALASFEKTGSVREAGIPFIYSQYAWQASGTEKLLEFVPVKLSDIRGAFHVHTTWSDGVDSLETTVIRSVERGLEYIGISDHSRSSFYANGLSEERLLRQIEEIEKLNEKYKPFRIFKGVECDILKDGALDYSGDILDRLDFIVASVHSNFKMEKSLMTERIQKAISAPYPIMLGHMSGRLLNSRAGYDLDHDKIFETAAANSGIIELNCNPHRMDVDPCHMPALKKLGVKISVNPDAHSAADVYGHLIYGVNGVNLGGLSKEDIINTMSLNEIAPYLERIKKERIKNNG